MSASASEAGIITETTEISGGKIMIQINAMGDACPIPVVKQKGHGCHDTVGHIGNTGG